MNIGYLFRDKAAISGLGRVTYGMAVRVDDRNHIFGAKDVIIEVARDLWGLLNDELKEYLIHHELCHVTFTLNEQGTGIEITDAGRPVVGTLPHDFEDFEAVMDRFPKGRESMKSVTKQYIDAIEKEKQMSKNKKGSGAKPNTKS